MFSLYPVNSTNFIILTNVRSGAWLVKLLLLKHPVQTYCGICKLFVNIVEIRKEEERKSFYRANKFGRVPFKIYRRFLCRCRVSLSSNSPKGISKDSLTEYPSFP